MRYEIFLRYLGGIWNKFITLKRGYETKFVCFNRKIVLIQFNITAPFMVKIIFHTSLPSLSHKRFDHCSSSLPCSLCCDFISLHELMWRSTWWHKYYSKNGCKRDYCTAYLIHSVIIFNPICTGGAHNKRTQINIYPSSLNKLSHLSVLSWLLILFLCRHDCGKIFLKIQSYPGICQIKVSWTEMGKCGLDSIFWLNHFQRHK
jgi:hypothetical protein